MDCPRCRLSLREVDYEGQVVDMCGQCWGMWLDTGELEVILERKEFEFTEGERDALLDVMTASRPGRQDPISCPKCSATMERVHYDESVHVVIDRCPDHGVWFDTGELKKIEALADKSAGIHRMILVKLGLRS